MTRFSEPSNADRVYCRLTSIDGKCLDRTRLIGDFVPLLRAKLDPLTQKNVAAVYFHFELRAGDSKSVGRIDVTMKSSTNLAIYSYGF
jgi:hypothetical protein